MSLIQLWLRSTWYLVSLISFHSVHWLLDCRFVSTSISINLPWLASVDWMSRSIRDLRELICLSRFGFRPDEIVPQEEIQTASPKTNILFYFDPSILDSWLELTSTRMDRLRSLTSHSLVDFIHFWLTQFDDQHKLSLFQMEFELFVEHLTLAFTPNDTDAKQINEFARNILHDIDFQQNDPSLPENNRKLIRIIDIFNRSKRDDEYRHLLANLPVHLTEQTNDHLHLQWMLAIRAFALVSLCVSAVEFFEKIQETLDKVRHRGDERPTGGADRTLFDNFSQQMKDRVVAALRFRQSVDFHFPVEKEFLFRLTFQERFRRRDQLFHRDESSSRRRTRRAKSKCSFSRVAVRKRENGRTDLEIGRGFDSNEEKDFTLLFFRRGTF